MTFISAALAGLFAWRDHSFALVPWLALTFGLILAHASNNIFNDFTDYVRGVDKDNYFRTIYGAQPIASGLMTKRQHLTYFAVTGLLALVFGLYLIFINAGDPVIWILLALGAFFVLFYTWPLKYIALGRGGRAGGLGSAHDRWGILRADSQLELVRCHRQPALRARRDHGHLRQAH